MSPGMPGSRLFAILALGHTVVTPHAARHSSERAPKESTNRTAARRELPSTLRGNAGGGTDAARVNKTGSSASSSAAPSLTNHTLGGLVQSHQTKQQDMGSAPCACLPHSSSWVKCQRTVPKCIWIDLGAADGNTLKAFLNNQYGPVGNCPSSGWEALLVEANPRFNPPLEEISARWPGSVHLYESTAAYMCPAQAEFYLDTVTHDHNYWGSSLSSNAADVQNSGLQKVSVPMVNLNQILYEQTIPGDWVMVKMDIEGAEWDIIPCLALSPSATLIDRMFVEFHNQSMGLVGTDQATLDAAQQMLRMRGVDIPNYFSNTL